MRVPAALLAALLAVLLLGGCSSSGDGPKAPPAGSPVASTAAGSSPRPTATPELVTIDVLPEGFRGGFTSPSGNIACDLYDDSVTCSVRDQPWKQMPVEGDCRPGQWETVVSVSKASTAGLHGQCARPDGGPELAYGRGVQLGKARCALRTAGLECVILGSSQGFFVSRSTYRLTAAGSSLARVPTRSSALTRIPAGFRGGFQSPSGNITCSLALKAAGCEVEDHTWKAPGHPEECESEYEYDGGGTPTTEAWVEEKGRGELYQACRYEGDFGGVELAYGTGLLLGDFRCRSLATGIECTNLKTKHGFVVSKAAYKVF